MNSFVRKSMSTLVYGSQAWVDPLTTIHLSLIFGVFKCLSFCIFWPTALKLGCITNFDMLSLVMGFISLVNANQHLPYFEQVYRWNDFALVWKPVSHFKKKENFLSTIFLINCWVRKLFIEALGHTSIYFVALIICKLCFSTGMKLSPS